MVNHAARGTQSRHIGQYEMIGHISQIMINRRRRRASQINSSKFVSFSWSVKCRMVTLGGARPLVSEFSLSRTAWFRTARHRRYAKNPSSPSGDTGMDGGRSTDISAGGRLQTVPIGCVRNGRLSSVGSPIPSSIPIMYYIKYNI